ncbi:MAG TPA: 16S rRNA (adenine(1518)-N(6)/adenine(1519)-N(6))-dimethyltransferase RsmA [Thermoplasmata archaeon]|nr:16S rRNA (adenine(1518)-N(6)/adenine(1519)-N(6))-dimethyltransferase RsmA [Thermoplasmata archaeon]
MSTTSTGSSSPPRPTPAGAPRSRAEVREALERIGIRPRRSAGQSFLVDPFVADAEAAVALPVPGASAVEIGGGLGLLTEALLRRGPARLEVIERDPRLAAHLERTFGDRITVTPADALEHPTPPADVVVGNLPFSSSVPILQRLFLGPTPRVVALVQREVADRLAAGPGSRAYGRLSIQAALYGAVETFRPVPSEAFEPRPKVEARLVAFARRPGPLPVDDPAAAEALVRAVFGARRKQLTNLLPRSLPAGTDADALAARAGWPPDWRRRRPEELPPEAYFRLAQLLLQRARADARRRARLNSGVRA